MISVIIPVYKVEEYLPLCIESVIHQTYNELEIILVDDGSPDKCGDICDRYAALDSRVKVVHKENGGISSARNAGLEIATGEYVAFVDSDDWLSLNMLEQLYNAISSKGGDCAVCGMKDEYSSSNLDFCEGEILWQEADKGASLELVLCNEKFYGYACNKLFSRELIGHQRFDEKLRFCEDLDFTVKYIEKCEKTIYTLEDMYHYRHHGLSMTGDMKYNPIKLSVLDAYEGIAPIYMKHRADLLPEIEKNYLKIAINILGRMKISGVKEEEISLRLNKIVKEYYPRVMNSNISAKTKINIFVSRRFPGLLLRLKQKTIKIMQRNK